MTKRNRAVFWLLYIVFLIIFAEVSAQILLSVSSLNNSSYGYPNDLYVYHEELDYRLRENFSGTFHGATFDGIRINTNSLGLRDYELPLSKPARTRRVVIIGDSITFGAGVELKNTYAKQLETLLHLNKKTYQVINAGVSHYQFEHYYILITEGYLDKLAPDHIIIGFCINDVRPKYYAHPSYLVARNSNRTPRERLIFISKRLVENVALFALYERVVNSTRFGRERYELRWIHSVMDSWENHDLVRNLTRMLAEVKEVLAKKGIRLSVVIFPELHQLLDDVKYGMPRDKILSILKGLNIEYIDLYDSFKGRDNVRQYFLAGDPVHFTAMGHQIIAKQIESELFR